MEVWMIFAALAVLSLAIVLLPAITGRKTAGADDSDFDAQVYRDQLAELERDRKRGLIGKEQAKSAHNEIARRLLAARSRKTGQTAPQSAQKSIAIAAGVLVITIAGAGLLYKDLGRPFLADQPHAKRIAQALKTGDMRALIWQVQDYLRKNPKDLKGWSVLAPALKRANRYGEAADAYARIMQLRGTDADTLTEYAESLLLTNRGTPNAQSRAAIAEALKKQPKHKKARFYRALTLQQDGKPLEALKQWRLLMAQNPKDLRLQMAAQRQIAALKLPKGLPKDLPGVKMPKLDKSQRDAAAAMSAKDRQAMINSMVERLAGKLAENPQDVDGWMRLIRAQVVLGRKQAAASSLKTASNALKDNAAALAKLKNFSARLGLNVTN